MLFTEGRRHVFHNVGIRTGTQDHSELFGFSCVSLWRFLTDEGLAAKAEESTASGIAELGYPKEQFGKGDCLLGWKNEKGAYRYCHSFSDEEINDLVSAVSNEAYLKARFQADGRTGTLNEYLVLQRKR